MGVQVDPADAARALAEIGRRREQVIRQALVPDGFWWLIGVQLIVLTAALESAHGLLLGLGIAQFVGGILATIAVLVLRQIQGAPPRNDMIDPTQVIGLLVRIMAFVVVTVGVSLAVGFSLEAAQVSHPATITVAVVAVLLGIGGPMLMRQITRVMLASPTGSDG